MKTNLRWTVLAVALLGACGDDDDNGNVAGQGGTSASGTSGTSGSGGTGGATAGQGGTISGGSGQGGAGAGGAAGSSAAGASGSAGSGQSSLACPGLVMGPTGHLTGQTLKVGALDRTYSLDVPAAFDPAKKIPVVFVFHGDGGDGEGIRGGYNFGAVAGNDAIFVYPDATADSGKSFDISHVNNLDLDFFDALNASLAQSYCVDPARVFAAGMSRGGYFANWLGCQRGDKLRAIAPHSGSIYSDEANVQYTDEGSLVCPTPAPAAIVFHGESDNVVPFKDGQYGLLEWTVANTCGQSSKPFDPSPCVAYDGCKADHPVVWCAIPGLGHDIWQKATQATWNFFKSL